MSKPKEQLYLNKIKEVCELVNDNPLEAIAGIRAIYALVKEYEEKYKSEVITGPIIGIPIGPEDEN